MDLVLPCVRCFGVEVLSVCVIIVYTPTFCGVLAADVCGVTWIVSTNVLRKILFNRCENAPALCTDSP